jgi:hypothetical protein
VFCRGRFRLFDDLGLESCRTICHQPRLSLLTDGVCPLYNSALSLTNGILQLQPPVGHRRVLVLKFDKRRACLARAERICLSL